MQVFMPYADPKKSVCCLDPKRLGNQIWREAKTLLNGGWKHHPAAKMWKPYPQFLSLYCLHGIDELLRRNHLDPNKANVLREYFRNIYMQAWIVYPPFIGDDRFHESHRRALLWKNPSWYQQFGWGVVPTEQPEYVWPKV